MRAPTDLQPGEYAALAFLAIEAGHGYEVARRWDASPLALIAPADQSTVYTYLRGLERRALVDWDEVRVGRRPPRRIYAPNEDGWSVLRAWLKQPVTRMREVRHEFLLKWYFLREVDPAAERALIRAQAQVCRTYIDDARVQLETAEGFERLVWESRLTAAEGVLAWLDMHTRPRSRAAS